MLQLETVVNAIKDQVRFKQSVNPDIPELVASLVSPTTSRLVDHPLLTNEILDAIAPDFNNWNYTTWVDANYSIGDRVKFNQNIYEANAAIAAPAGDPESNGDWTLIAGLSGYLEDKREEAARNVVNSLQNGKKNDRGTKEMLDNHLLYAGNGRLENRIVKQDRSVGFQIKVLDQTNIKVILETIGLQLDTAQNPVTLYLYHSSRVNPLATIDLDYTEAGSVQWFDQTADNVLQYEDLDDPADQLAGGSYFLMYFEEDLTGQAINYVYNFDGGAGCNSCSKYNLSQYNKWSKFVNIKPVRVSANNIPVGRTMFDVQNVEIVRDTNWGLNLRVTSYCDLTQYFSRHPEIFADALNRQLTVDLLREVSNSIQNNLISENTSDKARFALADPNLGGEGELKKLNKALDALGFEFSNIQSSNCMPRIARKGVYVGAIGPKNKSLSLNNGYQGFKQPSKFRP